MGADPIAAAILHQGAARGLAYDAFVVRKEPKDHGRGKQVEGPDVAGKRVIVLEDTSTTGGSPLKAIEALRAVGAEVVAVAVVVDRATGAREVIEAAGVPVPGRDRPRRPGTGLMNRDGRDCRRRRLAARAARQPAPTPPARTRRSQPPRSVRAACPGRAARASAPQPPARPRAPPRGGARLVLAGRAAIGIGCRDARAARDRRAAPGAHGSRPTPVAGRIPCRVAPCRGARRRPPQQPSTGSPRGTRRSPSAVQAPSARTPGAAGRAGVAFARAARRAGASVQAPRRACRPSAPPAVPIPPRARRRRPDP